MNYSVDNILYKMWNSSAFQTISWSHGIMIVISLILIYLAIGKKFEPLLLLPIGFGMLLGNLPLTGIMDSPTEIQPGGLLYYLYFGLKTGVYPALIFLGVGAMTDFGPLIARPSSIFLGAAAQIGIYVAFISAVAIGVLYPSWGFTLQEAASIGIIGGADGPTAIFLSSRLAPEILPAIAIAAYSYMALIPIIQPPLMRLIVSTKEQKIKMEQLREVSKLEKIIFPIMVTLFVVLFLPSSAPLIGMLMLGNLLKESGVVDRLSETAQNTLINIVTIFLGLTVGSSASGESFLNVGTLLIIGLGLIAFVFGTVGGLFLGKLLCFLSKGKINPLIGSAGISAVPMAARLVQVQGRKVNPSNFLLMHAMGPNVAGVIGSAVAAGIFLAIFG
jgi:carboxybiotin decarboxylase